MQAPEAACSRAVPPVGQDRHSQRTQQACQGGLPLPPRSLSSLQGAHLHPHRRLPFTRAVVIPTETLSCIAARSVSMQ